MSHIKSPIRWAGGKQKALQEIWEQMPVSKGNCRQYREPFIGGGSVFLYAYSHGFAQTYWINDLYVPLIQFWREATRSEASNKRLRSVLEDHLRNIGEGNHTARWLHDEYKKLSHGTLAFDPLQQSAIAFFYLNRVTFSGTVEAGGFSQQAADKRFTQSSIDRIKPLGGIQVNITCLDFEHVIEADGQDVFMFLDPPYASSKKLYGKNGELHNFDHKRLADVLRRTKHTWLMTYDDSPVIRELYEGWANIQSWSLQYGMNNSGKTSCAKGQELFISNY